MLRLGFYFIPVQYRHLIALVDAQNFHIQRHILLSERNRY